MPAVEFLLMAVQCIDAVTIDDQFALRLPNIRTSRLVDSRSRHAGLAPGEKQQAWTGWMERVIGTDVDVEAEASPAPRSRLSLVIQRLPRAAPPQNVLHLGCVEIPLGKSHDRAIAI